MTYIDTTDWAPKDPDEVKDYSFNWKKQMDADGGDTITSSEWTVAEGDDALTIDTPVATFTSIKTTVWVGGGTAGTEYILNNHVITNGRREYDRSWRLRVRDL